MLEDQKFNKKMGIKRVRTSTVPPAVICTSGRVNRKGRTREVHAGGTRRNRAVHERNPRGSRTKT